ncbi:hypothetical protein [Clostridium sp. ZS2-4]|uniref:hypothetical protein n=1 Tax=Clostridium sp. ZS2-4 TaxID=2987703 RepID=UPI00227D2F4C|nr:hypothetical protein [Clostridium sp. ZS2-4]MCY6356000.1 hypothetical protein [Clostridium sp. ZS2-4]
MLDKLKNFYLKLPKDILESSEDADYNRETRRQLKRYKKIQTKINYILKDETRHQTFRKYIYDKYNSINIECNDINEVINSINESNFVQSMIYMLKEFYNDNKFKEYVLSDNYEECVANFMNSNTHTDKDKENQGNDMEENKEEMNKYIVTIEYKNGFCNIYPLFSLKNGKLNKVKESYYPDYGNINVNPWSEFSKKNYDIISPLWICKFDYSQLEETQNKTKFKIDGDKLIKNKSICTINDEGIYEVVELLEDNSVLEQLIYNNKPEIKNKPILEKIYIKDNNYVYGPFGYKENNQGGGYYIDKKNSDYIIEKYSIKDNESYLSINEIENPYNYNNSFITVVYFHNKKNLISENIDIISKEELLDKVKQIINMKNTHYSRNEIEEIRKNINFIIDNSLSEERRKRLKELIENTETTDKFIETDLIDIIGLLLDGKDTKESIASKILNQHEILRKLQNVELVQAKIDSKNEELNKAKQELEQIQLSIKDSNDKNKEQLIANIENDLKSMLDKKEKIEKAIEELSERYELCDEIDLLYKRIEDLKKKAKEAEDDYNVFSRKNQNMRNEAEKIEKEIRVKLENATSISKYSDIAFDGMIANEMLESAAKWTKEKYIENFEKAIASKENVEKIIEVKSFKDDNIIEYIHEKVRQSRDYGRNDITNIMICLTQGFLTVFAGEPGTGKTSMCNIIAKILGLANKNSDYNRFTEISVEKGWTSKRDLVGYYNPLTKSFDKNNSSLFKVFNILHQECIRDIEDFPYYILLDEANLSSMEHYWADFMNVCDFDKENRKINLGEDYIYDIPKTLRFLATINYDHTTETLSPRLIDRAWIISLETNNFNLFLNNNQEQQTNDNIIMFKDLEKCFSYYSYCGSDEELPNQMYEELDEIYKIFKEINISISPRVDSMIKRYLKVGCKLFEKTESTAQEFVALDYVVAQKLLPKVNGYGDEYRKFLKGIEEKFDKNNMMKCKNIIENIIKKGDTNMQYYQFFS